MSQDDRTSASGPLFISIILLGLSVLSVAAEWLLRANLIAWWAEKGLTLPEVTAVWVSPVWHIVGAVVLVVFAGLVAVRDAFGIALGMWMISYGLYAAYTFRAIYVPWCQVASMAS